MQVQSLEGRGRRAVLLWEHILLLQPIAVVVSYSVKAVVNMRLVSCFQLGSGSGCQTGTVPVRIEDYCLGQGSVNFPLK